MVISLYICQISKMRHIAGIIVCVILAQFSVFAENWDFVKSSGQYYYGTGKGTTEEEADRNAIADMVSMIATHVSSDFTQIDDSSQRSNGVNDHSSKVLNCVKTYSGATVTNSEKIVSGKAPNFTVRRYMKKSELDRIYANRIDKAKNMIEIADECLEHRKIDMAIQYYYWAYSLIRSVQFPNEVKDGQGHTLVDWIPVKIDAILSDINVEFVGKDGDFIDLAFTYQGEPVSTLEFAYSDGRTVCEGLAKDGKGSMEMIPGYSTDVYHLDVEYQYKNHARGDAELESVLGVITPKIFSKSAFKINARNVKEKLHESLASKVSSSSGSSSDTVVASQSGQNSAGASGLAAMTPMSEAKVSATPVGINEEAVNTVEAIISALKSKSYSSVAPKFTIGGLEMFNRLTSYGKVRVLDDSRIKYYNGLGGRTVARGLNMSFAFEGRRKKTFVEDISFTIDPDGRVENVAFGLGKEEENNIFNRASSWSQEVREIIVSFMENYKTAYSLERIDYIRDIFADDAVIIVGNVVKRRPASSQSNDVRSLSLKGQDLISYNRYTKKQYIEQLRRCFNRNDYINLKFSDYQVQWLEKFDKETLFAINLRQEYNSSTYADNGYLFLLVDMTNSDEPLIKVRTWQPNEVDISKLYNAGDFFND